MVRQHLLKVFEFFGEFLRSFLYRLHNSQFANIFQFHCLFWCVTFVLDLMWLNKPWMKLKYWLMFMLLCHCHANENDRYKKHINFSSFEIFMWMCCALLLPYTFLNHGFLVPYFLFSHNITDAREWEKEREKKDAMWRFMAPSWHF